MSNTSYPPFLKWGDYHSKDEKNPDEIIVEPSEPIETDFGQRQVSHQNFSRIVALPKIALQNCGIESQVIVTLVQQNGERYLKLSPNERSETK